jgi:hypothetical protein
MTASSALGFDGSDASALYAVCGVALALYSPRAVGPPPPKTPRVLWTISCPFWKYAVWRPSKVSQFSFDWVGCP